jgi:tRNA1Val (adenine37-N6)-methyltransferase
MAHKADLAGTATARALFPRGLLQPGGLFRFSADALLLASFGLPSGKENHILDLGCGCGVVAFAAMLPRPGVSCLGVDADARLLAAAGANARKLGLDSGFTALLADLAEPGERRRIPACAFDLAYANPPYHPAGHSRLSREPGRIPARFDRQGLLRAFLLAARRGLKSGGRFFLVFPAARLAELLAELRPARLEPRRLRPVQSRVDNAARLVLVEAKKDAGPGLVLEPPLILHQGEGENTRFSQEALDFCPHLCQGGAASSLPSCSPSEGALSVFRAGPENNPAAESEAFPKGTPC